MVSISKYRRKLIGNLKNVPGWRTKRKIVVFSIDDFGNIRMASSQARQELAKAGLNVEQNRFDQYDSLETAEDLRQLFDALSSVRDKHGRHAVITAFALPANIDFDAMRQSGYQRFQYELLPDTLARLQHYDGTWTQWQLGIKEKIFVPQFHGREHINISFLMTLLAKRDPEIIQCFANSSYGGISPRSDTHTDYASAFAFNDFSENDELEKLVLDGLDVFRKVFGYSAEHFNSPGGREHHILERTLAEGGIRFIDTDMVKREHQGHGKFRRRLHYLGEKNGYGQTYLIRNCVFEPLLDKDCVESCLTEIATAFRWNKPANISSHRVNFCGYIDPGVRAHGLRMLRELLKKIVQNWPDVEFVSTVELGNLIVKK